MNTECLPTTDRSELNLMYYSVDHLRQLARGLRNNKYPNLGDYPGAKGLFITQAKYLLQMAEESPIQMESDLFENLVGVIERDESYADIMRKCSHISKYVLNLIQSGELDDTGPVV